jgi:serine/threonine protein kinase
MRSQFVEGRVLDGRYECISRLQQGSFGMVFRAKDLHTGELVAIKCMTKSSTAGFIPEGFAVDERSEELDIHLRIGSHPNIVNLLHSFETANHKYLVLEFCPNGDLFEAIKDGKGPLQTQHVRDFMLELVDAVEHLHSLSIFHRDIKPENILLTQSGSMKLGDFGLATTESWSFESAVGSDRYMAPEQYDPGNTGYSPAKADIWAIGILLLNILFSRNPFNTPTMDDPIFADFVKNKQSLFDYFSAMSQDTFEILDHCLSMDPSKRSLTGVREALKRALFFTTDEEDLDEFCVADREGVPATANREPLRTPSMTSPQLDQGGSFPWAKALAMTPQQATRQLSVIHDSDPSSEEFLPESKLNQDWYSVKPDSASTISFVDSGLGVSYSSTDSTPQARLNKNSRSKNVPVVGSLPINISKPGSSLSSILGKKRDMFSKSWSDMWDEDEEVALSDSVNSDTIARVKSPKPTLKDRFWGRESDSGNSTPRAGLSEMKNPATVNNSRNRSPPNKQKSDEQVSEQTGFVFESDHALPRQSTSARRTIMDKWTALGERRRGNSTSTPQKQSVQRPVPQTSTPRKSSEMKRNEQKHVPPPTPSPGYPQKRSRGITQSWRRHFGWGNNYEGVLGNNNNNSNNNSNHGVFGRKEWIMSENWRNHPDPPQSDDIGDLEWVGGWKDYHV